MDVERGMLCCLTHEKVAFEQTCEQFESDPEAGSEADPEAERKERAKDAALLNNLPVRGWLAFFLWVGLGLGGIVSVGVALREAIVNQYNYLFSGVFVGSAFLLLLVAIYAISAFYRCRSNAVAIARTYIAMVVIDGLVGALLLIYADDHESLASTFRQFIWAAIWFSYLKYSTRVAESSAPAFRTWGVVEKYALGLYAICNITLVAMVFAQWSSNVIMRGESYIRQGVEAAKAELPIDIGNGVEMAEITYGQGAIRYDLRCLDVDKNWLEEDFIAEYAVTNKAEILDNWALSVVHDPFLGQCCREKMTMVYRYFDRSDQFLYQVVVTPEEYQDRLSGGDLIPRPEVLE